jgi:cytoskeletal protein CcmA (bactofilin family)
MGIFQKRSPDNPLAALQPPPPEREPQPVSSSPPPPFLRDNEVRTSIGADAVINGKLAFTTPTRVEGKLKGELRCTQLLIIGSTAVVEGWVKADELRVEGLVRGEIAETRKVEICPQGKLIGTVSSRLLIIREGGYFEGQCAVGPTSSATASLGAEADTASG